MKIFALYLRLNLIIKPKWFDDFRNKYASRSILHITLVQPRYVAEDQIQGLKDKVEKVLRGVNFNPEDKKVIFDKTEIEEEEGTLLFMWFVDQNKSIMNLQRNLVEELEDLNNYCNEITIEYESNFRPHMTIADMIPNDEKVEKLLAIDGECIGELTDLVLSVVKDMSIEESENIRNFTLFNL